MPVHGVSGDWPPHYWKCVSYKQLPVTQNWLQQDAIVSSHATASVHTPSNPTWHTDHPQEWKPDPEMSLKGDDLYARNWECEYEKPIFDAENNNATQPNSPDFPIQSGLGPGESWNTIRTAQECPLVFFPQTEELCDVTDTYPYMEPDTETSSGQPNKIPTNHRTFKNTLRHNPKPNCNDDYRYYFLRVLVCPTERVHRRPRKYRNVSRNKYAAVQKVCYILFWLFPGD